MPWATSIAASSRASPSVLPWTSRYSKNNPMASSASRQAVMSVSMATVSSSPIDGSRSLDMLAGPPPAWSRRNGLAGGGPTCEQAHRQRVVGVVQALEQEVGQPVRSWGLGGAVMHVGLLVVASHPHYSTTASGASMGGLRTRINSTVNTTRPALPRPTPPQPTRRRALTSRDRAASLVADRPVLGQHDQVQVVLHFPVIAGWSAVGEVCAG